MGGLSMGGGGTWTIGLSHPELFSALAPVCGVTDVRKWIPPSETGDYDERELETYEPRVVHVNRSNEIVDVNDEVGLLLSEGPEEVLS